MTRHESFGRTARADAGRVAGADRAVAEHVEPDGQVRGTDFGHHPRAQARPPQHDVGMVGERREVVSEKLKLLDGP